MKVSVYGFGLSGNLYKHSKGSLVNVKKYSSVDQNCEIEFANGLRDFVRKVDMRMVE